MRGGWSLVENEWGRDPGVRMMRAVFNAMEEAQNRMLEALAIGPMDPRLRRWREVSLGLWERCWGSMVHSGAQDAHEKASGLYLACLSRVLGRDGVAVPEGLIPKDGEVEKVMREVLP